MSGRLTGTRGRTHGCGARGAFRKGRRNRGPVLRTGPGRAARAPGRGCPGRSVLTQRRPTATTT